MSDIRFYHLTARRLEDALPQLLARVLDRGQRALVRCGSAERAEALAAHLWTYDPASFLPHGTARDGHGPDQPVWITPGDDAPNGAQVLFLLDGRAAGDAADFEICCDMFDGRDEEAVAAARIRWKELLAGGHALTYWSQDHDGKWERKA